MGYTTVTIEEVGSWEVEDTKIFGLIDYMNKYSKNGNSKVNK